MLSALVLLRHAAAAEPTASEHLDAAEARRASAIADVLQLYSPTVLLSAPDRVCVDTLAPLAERLGLRTTVSGDLAADAPEFPDGGPAPAAAWLASRALRALPEARRTAVVCAEGVVLAALLVAVAARDDHDLSGYGLARSWYGPQSPPPGGGWVLHREGGRLFDVKTVAPR